MDSFITQQGNTHFDWYGFFRKIKTFDTTPEDLTEASQRASRWDMCFVSEQCPDIPRHSKTGIPKDMYLANLGVRFMKEITRGQYFHAERTLAQIEIVSAKIILNSAHQKIQNNGKNTLVTES